MKRFMVFLIAMITSSPIHADQISYYCETESVYVGAALGSYASGSSKSVILRSAARSLEKGGHDPVVVGKVLNSIEIMIDGFERDGGVNSVGINPNNQKDIDRWTRAVTEAVWIKCLKRNGR